MRKERERENSSLIFTHVLSHFYGFKEIHLNHHNFPPFFCLVDFFFSKLRSLSIKKRGVKIQAQDNEHAKNVKLHNLALAVMELN